MMLGTAQNWIWDGGQWWWYVKNSGKKQVFDMSARFLAVFCGTAS
jgi:hypothetical protein